MNSPSPSPFLLASGVVLAGTYRIERPLGKGGMGEVYEASHARLAGRYAVKLLLREMGDHPEVLRRFMQEAEVTSRLRHPNIVQVIDFALMPDGTPFLVMEFLEGRDLADELRATGPMPLARVCHIIEHVALGLSAAHAAQIVHRDLKPANIFATRMMGSDRELFKIVDFGISKVRAATTGLTQTQTIIGTPQYMSPEQARGAAREIDARTDQFALGTIAYELITGQPAFQGDGVASVLYQVVHEPAPRFAAIACPELPAIEAVLNKAMAKRPEDRFDSVEDMATAFAEAVRAPDRAPAWLSSAPAGPPPSPSGQTRRFTGALGVPSDHPTTLRGATGQMAARSDETLRGHRRGPAKLVAIAVGSIVVATVVFMMVGRDRSPTSAAVPLAAPSAARATAPISGRARDVLVEVHGLPEGARVTIDGRPVSPPVTLAALPGRRLLRAEAPGHHPQERTIDGERDAQVVFSLRAIQAEAEQPSAKARRIDRRADKKKRPSNLVEEL